MKFQFAFFAFAMAVFFAACNTQPEVSNHQEFRERVSAHTTGIISRMEPVVFRLAAPSEQALPAGTKTKNTLFTFEPNVEGSLIWKDTQTILFQPEDGFLPGTEYTVGVDLGAILPVPKDQETFIFQFMTNDIRVKMSLSSLNYYSPMEMDLFQLTGEFYLTDETDQSKLQQCLNASLDSEPLKIKWDESPKNNKYRFSIDSIPRNEDEQSLEVKFAGSKASIDQTFEEALIVPALGDFKIVTTEVIQDPEQEIVVKFSDPLNPDQKIGDLLQITDGVSFRTIISTNEVHVFPEAKLSGSKDLIISSGIQNLMGFASKSTLTIPLIFEKIKPSIKWNDVNKTILPSTEGLVIPFEAVALNAVDVKVIKIFEDNVHQFLQVNDLEGNQELRRVGRVIRKKTVQLGQDGQTDLRRWNTFFLDLTELIEPDQGAIYQVKMSFRHAQSVYECDETNSESILAYEPWDNHGEDEAKNYDMGYRYYWEQYYDHGYYDYDYNQRDNPCHPTFYRYVPVLSRNILASDIGLIAKAGKDQTWHIAAANLVDAEPQGGVTLKLYNYQEMLMGQTQTNGEGLATINGVEGQPFLLVAESGKQKGYLKLTSGSNISHSKFDVGGQQLREGLNGYIYGERGVWRPGDTLFLSFILQDREDILPSSHPIKFQLFDVRGRLVQKEVKTYNDQPIHTFTAITDKDAQTGNYRLAVDVGGAHFSKTIKVETVKPNRLKIDLDFDDDEIYAGKGGIEGNLKLQWLHGAIAKDLRVKVDLSLSNTYNGFEGYGDYHFRDRTRRFGTDQQTIFDANVDNEGQAKINYLPTLNQQPPGKLRAYFDIKAFEKGGDFSIDGFSVQYSPYPHYVGMKVPRTDNYYALETDKEHRFELISLDEKGQPVKGRSLQYEVYKLQWRWWWSGGYEDFSRYTASEGILPMHKGEITSNSQGKSTFDITVNDGDYGRYLVRVIDEDGHASSQTVYFDWPRWRRNQRSNPDGANMLMLTADKETYEVGENCKFTWPNSPEAQVLVTIENSTSVLKKEWVQLNDEMGNYSFKIEPGMAPNVYAHVMLVQPHDQTANEAPMRMYGVIPIQVEDPKTKLEPILDTPESIRPETTFEVQVSEKNDQAMNYTLAVVDEGLLALTRYKTPAPHPHFCAKQALGVKTWDLYTDIIGAHGMDMGELLNIGGDGSADEDAENSANRFKPVVRFIGPFHLNPGQNQTHRIQMDNYVGDVRVMVVAASDVAYGHAQANIKVKKPLMVLATLPRVLSPGEEVELPVNVFAMEEQIKNVQLSLETNDLLQPESTTQSVQFEKTGDKIVSFKIKVPDVNGIAKAKVKAKSGNETAYHEIELDVRNPNPEVQHFEEAVLRAGENWDASFPLVGTKGTNTISLEASYLPAINLDGRLRQLLRYPHGCVEQTTSKAMPQLFLNRVMELDDQVKNRIDQHVMHTVNRLSLFQTADGGLAYWPGGTQANEWGTNYAGHFLLEAENEGYSFPSAMKKKWISYQKKTAREWRRPSNDSQFYEDQIQAYRLYTLALAGTPDISAMNRLREGAGLGISTKWRLAAAYATIGQKDAARQLVNGLNTEVDEYRALGYQYGSNHRDLAMILETLIILEDDETAADVCLQIAEHMRSQRWMSTQEMAWSIMALAKFAGDSNEGRMTFTYQMNDESGNIDTNMPMVTREISPSFGKEQSLRFNNTSSKLLYVTVINIGKPAVGREVAEANDLRVDVSYMLPNGSGLNHKLIPQGTDFIAKVKISNPSARRRYAEMALTQVFPSGWEIINERMTSGARTTYTSDYADYKDYRDDRVNTYFHIPRNGTKTFYVRLNASYLGKYYLPSVSCEAMYDNTIYAHTAGTWVEVVSNQ